MHAIILSHMIILIRLIYTMLMHYTIYRVTHGYILKPYRQNFYKF